MTKSIADGNLEQVKDMIGHGFEYQEANIHDDSCDS